MPLLSIECQTLTKQSRWIIAMSMVHLPKNWWHQSGVNHPPIAWRFRVPGWSNFLGVNHWNSPEWWANPFTNGSRNTSILPCFLFKIPMIHLLNQKMQKKTLAAWCVFLSPKNPRTNTNKTRRETIDCGEGFPLYTCRILVLRAKMRPRRRPPLRYPPCWASASPRWGEPGIVRWTGK